MIKNLAGERRARTTETFRKKEFAMNGFADYDRYDATGLAQLVRDKETTALELCEAAIARIEAINPKINAVIHTMFDEALQVAAGPLPDGPFTGVPFLLKDLLAAYAGEPFTQGCRGYRNFIPGHDSELVRRYKKTGLVVLGKTNTPEFGLLGVTEPELHGPTRNPWNPERSPGGSSGGSGAAVASGMVPMASGGDGGGSIRIPSAWCGLFGLKPSRGRVPAGPDSGELWQGAAQEHVLTRSVRDSAAMLDAICGPEPGAPYEIPQPRRPYMEEAATTPAKLKIGFNTASPIGLPVHDECIKAVHTAARLLSDLGHIVEEKAPAIDGAALASVISQWLGAAWAMAALHATLGFNRRMQGSDILRLFHIGGDLFLRTGFLTGFLVLTTRAATRIGADSGAAHQAIRQVWVMSALLLDAFAISGQSLVGFFMGAARVDTARRVARVVCQWSLGAGLVIGLVMWVGQGLAALMLVPLSAHAVFYPAWHAAIIMQPANALAFASDGIHWGSGDFRYLRNVMMGVSLAAAATLLWFDRTHAGPLDWIWVITAGWVTGRAVFGVQRVWPGVGQSPFAPVDKLWHK